MTDYKNLEFINGVKLKNMKNNCYTVYRNLLTERYHIVIDKNPENDTIEYEILKSFIEFYITMNLKKQKVTIAIFKDNNSLTTIKLVKKLQFSETNSETWYYYYEKNN